MAYLQTSPEQPIEGNDPFGMSRYSLRRYSMQHFLLIVVTHVLLVALLVTRCSGEIGRWSRCRPWPGL